jgi:MoxR-like ATPase
MSLPPEVKSIVDRLKQLRSALGADFVARDEVIDLLGLAVVCHEHLLLVGPPGTAKTELVNRFSDLVRAKRFHYQLTRFTEPTELFGPLDLAQFQKGTYHVSTAGMLPEAQVAFLDEVFQGSSAILNTLLTLVNERTFYNGAVPERVPLVTLVGASNALPDDPVLKAFADRFVLRVAVEPVGADRLGDLLDLGWAAEQNRMRVARGGGERPAALLDAGDKAELDVVHRAVAGVDVRDVKGVYADAVREMRAAGIELSDRRVVRGLKLTAGAAVLRGTLKAEPRDLWPLRHCWTRPEEAATLRQVLAPHLGADRANAEPARPAHEIVDELVALEHQSSGAKREGQIVGLLTEYNTIRREVHRDHSENELLLLQVDGGIRVLMDLLTGHEEATHV